MKKLIVVIVSAGMLAALAGCANDANIYKADPVISETEILDAVVNIEDADHSVAESAEHSLASQSNEGVVIIPDTPTDEKEIADPIKPPQNNSSVTSDSPTPSKINPADALVTLSLGKNFITIDIGQSAEIIATVAPSGNTVLWDSGEESIATVKNGTVTGVSAGSTAIIVKAGGVEKRCTVVVRQPAVSFDSNVYLDYAKSYATKLGLIYDDSLSGGSWNAWINLYSALSDATIKKNIEGSLQILLNENCAYYKLHLEKQGENDYRLFIFYG